MEYSEHLKSDEPCAICGTNILYLSSGFYFCVECGTQKDNFQEQMIEYNDEIDNKKLTKTKIRTTKDESELPEMNSSRMNVHCLNYILCGLVDEVIAAGASTNLKRVVLQLWIKLLQKEDIAFTVSSKEKYKFAKREVRRQHSEPDAQASKGYENRSDESDMTENFFEEMESLKIGFGVGLNENPIDDADYLSGKTCITMYTFYSLIYLALNMIGDDMQLGDLLRLMRENRISYLSYRHFLPSDTKFTYTNFTHSSSYPTHQWLRMYIEKLAIKLDLKKPEPPDMVKLINRYLLELQLPSQLQLYIMKLYSDLPPFFRNHFLPDFEAKAMSYVVVILKLLFGLDDFTEDILSDLAEHKNSSNKSKMHQLFVWRKWTKFIEYRKLFIGNHHFPSVRDHDQSHLHEDAFLSHCFTSFKMSDLTEQNSILSGQLIDDMLTSLLLKHFNSEPVRDFPSYTFPPALTPYYTFLTILLNGEITEPFRRDILSEDHRSHSVEYLLKRNQKSLMYSEAKTISTIMKTYKRPDFVVIPNSEYLSIRSLKHTSLNHSTVFTIDCPEAMPWTNDEAQEFLYTKYTTLKPNLFIKQRYPFCKRKIQNVHESVKVIKKSDFKRKIKKILNKTIKNSDDPFKIQSDENKEREELNVQTKVSKQPYGYLYWMKHYSKILEQRNTIFEKELNNFPQSFSWLVRECASVIETRPVCLYKEVQNLEKMFVCFLKQHNLSKT